MSTQCYRRSGNESRVAMTHDECKAQHEGNRSSRLLRHVFKTRARPYIALPPTALPRNVVSSVASCDDRTISREMAVSERAAAWGRCPRKLPLDVGILTQSTAAFDPDRTCAPDAF